MFTTPAERDLDPATSRTRGFGVKRSSVVVLALAVLSAAAWYGLTWWIDGHFIETTDDAYIGGNVTSIALHVFSFIQSFVSPFRWLRGEAA